jgi:hypothetical protein
MEIYVVIRVEDDSAHIVKGKQALAELLGCSWKTAHKVVDHAHEQSPTHRKGWDVYIPMTTKVKAKNRGIL